MVDGGFLDTINWDSLRDNRDVPTADTWDGVAFTEEHRLDTFTEQVASI